MNLLLLRGLARDHRTWGEFPNRVLAHAPRMKIHCLDLPGIGTENSRPCPESIAAIRIEIAQRFHNLIAQSKLPTGPWSILGMSLGGMIALDWTQAEPDLFQKLILINTSTADVANPTERFRIRYLPATLYSLVMNRPEISERLILNTVSNRFVNDPGGRDSKLQSMLDDQIKWRKERPITRTTFLRQILSAAKYRMPAGRPKPKTVLIYSEGDRLVSSKCSSRLAERLGASRLSHPWAGHDIAIDDPEWLAKSLSEWMEASA